MNEKEFKEGDEVELVNRRLIILDVNGDDILCRDEDSREVFALCERDIKHRDSANDEYTGCVSPKSGRQDRKGRINE